MTSPIRFGQIRLAEIMGRVPGEEILGAGLVENELWCTDAGHGLRVIRHMLQVRDVVAVFLPGDQILGDPEVDVGSIIATIADQVIATVVPSDDAGVATIFLTDPVVNDNY